MQNVFLTYSPRHEAVGASLAAWLEQLGGKVDGEGAVRALVVADAQSWESEGIGAEYEERRRRRGDAGVFLIWVGGAPLPPGLPMGGWISGWTGGAMPDWVREAVRAFWERSGREEAETRGGEERSMGREAWKKEVRAEGKVAGVPMPVPAAPVPVPAPARAMPVTGPGQPRFGGGTNPVPAEELGADQEEFLAEEAEKRAEMGPEMGPGREEVRTTVYCPEKVAKGEWFTMQVWLHFSSQSEVVREMARETGHADLAGRKAGLRMAAGALVGFVLKPEVVHTKRFGWNRRETLHRYAQWTEKPTNVEFPVYCPPGHRGEVVHETIEISVEGIPIGTCTVTLRFGEGSVVETQFAKIRTAFASYSSKDRELVIGRLQMLAATVGVEPFFDVESLRMGEDWEQRLQREVPTKDRFLLFWSGNAKKSEWVEREWRLALRERGMDYILPVPLEPASPPAELRKLQFSDRYARMAEYERMKRQAGG